MNTTIFIAGSMNIKHLDPKVKAKIDNIIAQEYEIVVGDADGVDASIQEYLLRHGMKRITVFCSGERPRNNAGNWPTFCVQTNHLAGTRAFYTAKDICMAERADIGLMIWDTKSPGTLSNVLELLARRKHAVVFINKEKCFKMISTIEELEKLLIYMSDHSKQKADEKIHLYERISSLKFDQLQMFA